MELVEFNQRFSANITVMRDGAEFGNGTDQLEDGNVLPRLCSFVGEGACAKACQLKLVETTPEGSAKLCAEENIINALAEMYVNPENFAMVAATKDRVTFGDDLEAAGTSAHADGYTMVPESNAFFFRPDKDMTHGGRRKLTTAAMRMADCGDVIYSMKDRDGDDVVGIAHFSRTNMRGPSAYMHERDGLPVSWSEYVLGEAVEHYGADVASVQVKLVAAIERDDFVHHYDDVAAMVKHYPGWAELGFMHPQGGEDFDCLIDYREMIEWQLKNGIQSSELQLKPDQVELVDAINTGDLSLGHASHHAASKGVIAHGRDMYTIGLNKAASIDSRIEELSLLQDGRKWAMNTFGEMTEDDFRTFEDMYAAGQRELATLRKAKEDL